MIPNSGPNIAGINTNGHTRLGCIIRDWNGEVVYTATKTERVKWSPSIAEGRAVLFGLKKAIQRGVFPIIMESDCKRLVDSLARKEVDRTEFGSICADILELEAKSEVRKWSFAYRDANHAAHLLAHFIPPMSDECEWSDCTPHVVADVVACTATSFE